MSLDLTPEQKAIGRKNFEQAAADLERSRQKTDKPGDPTRRTFMKAAAAGAAVVPVSAAVYFGYDSWKGNKAVRTALIGCGDEGGVLVGDHNPEFIDIVAVCDLRPYNLERIFAGEKEGPRKGLNKIYGSGKQQELKSANAIFDDFKQLLAAKDRLGLEAVIIATPLHLHHTMAIECMKAGLHVLCEKLMARKIEYCKQMVQTAYDQKMLLSVGHQRHYSMLYAHALEVINSGVLGDLKHIRALWHRNNSWPYTPTEADKKTFAEGFDLPQLRDGWCKPVLKSDYEALKDKIPMLRELGYEDGIRQLVRWRLYRSTGGGLMAELGSHQLDASSIFLGKVKPIAVSGVGGKFFYGPGKNDRESDDGVFVNYEFPGPNHPRAGKGGKDESDIVVVSYSSFNTNSFEKYGECIMGSRGTMVVEEEKDVYLYKETEPGKAGSGGRDTAVTVSTTAAGKPAMESTSTWGGGGGAAISKGTSGPKWDSDVRGYRTEMEHFAYLVRKWDKSKGWARKGDGTFEQEVPRCHGEVAMADAILALTANLAMQKRQRIEFNLDWFKTTEAATPEKAVNNDQPA